MIRTGRNVTHRWPRRLPRTGNYVLAAASLLLVMWFFGEPSPLPFVLVLTWPVGWVIGRIS